MLWAVQGGFLNWDDDRFVLDNPHVRNLSIENISHAFGGFHFESYQPLHLVSYMIDGQLWTHQAVFYRLHSFFLYVVSICLLWILFRRLGLDVVPTTIGCLFFALAPYRVESVVWISARKDMLALFFSLIAWHLHITQSRTYWMRGTIFVLATVSFCAALLSKSAAVVIPLMIFISDIGLLKIRLRKAFFSMLPYLIPCIVIVVTVPALWFEKALTRLPIIDGFAGRMELIGWTFAHYFKTAIWPFQLSPLYAEPSKEVMLHGSIAGLLIFLGVVAVLIWLHKSGRLKPELPVAFAWFGIGILPFLNIIPLYYLVADRYLLFPSFGLALLVALICKKICNAKNKAIPYALGSALVAILLAWSVATYKECRAWTSSQNLWQHAIERQPHSFYARLKLGETLRNLDMPARSALEYRAARCIRPGSPTALGGLFWAALLVDAKQASLSKEDAEKLAYRFVAIANDGPKLTSLSAYLRRQGLKDAWGVVQDRIYRPMQEGQAHPSCQ